MITKIIDDINWQIESNIENINDDDDNGGCRDDSSKTVDDTIIDNKHEQNDIHNDKMDFDEKIRKAMAKIHEANVRKVTKKKIVVDVDVFFLFVKIHFMAYLMIVVERFIITQSSLFLFTINQSIKEINLVDWFFFSSLRYSSSSSSFFFCLIVVILLSSSSST